MKKYSLGMVLLAFSFLTVHFIYPEVFDFCPRISSAFSSQVVYADTDLSERDQGKIKEYYKLARQYYKEGNYGRTLTECQKIVKIDTYNINAHKLIKRARERLKRKKAKELAAQQKAQEQAALEAKRQVKRDLELKEAALKEQLKREEQIEEQAEKLKQKKLDELFDVASGLYSDRKYDAAIAQCRGILRIDSDNKSAQKLIIKSQERIQIAKERELADKEERAEQARLEAQKQAKLRKKEEAKEIEEKKRATERVEKEAQKREKLKKKEEAKELAAQQKAQEQAALEAKRQVKRDLELKEAALKEQLKREEQIEEQAEKLKQKKLDELFDVASGLYSDRKYDAAIAQCRGILRIDSDNKSAQKLIAKSEERIQIAKERELADKEKRAEQARLEAQKQAEKESKLKEEAQIRLQKQREKALEEQRRKEERIEKEAQKQAKLKKKEEAKELARQKEAEEKSAAETSKLAKQKAEKEADLIALQKKKIEERKQKEKEGIGNRIETHYRNGKKLYRDDEYPDAIEEFNAVLSLNSAHEGAKEYLKASEASLREQNERKSASQAKVAKKQIERKESLRKRDIQDRITDAKIKLDAGEYDEAIKMLEEILPEVLVENLRRSVELLISKARTEKAVKEEKLSQERLKTISDERMLEVTKAQLPPAEARRIKELERKKKKVDAARELRDKAASIKVPLVNYKDNDLRDVVLFLVKQTGINIVVDEALFSGEAVTAPAAAAEQVEGWAGEAAAVVQPTGPINTRVTFYAKDISLLGVLDAILRTKNLDYKFAKEYIWISTKAKILTQPLEDLETRVYTLEYGSSMNIKRLKESGFKTTSEDIETGLGEAGEETEGETGKVSGESIKELLETLVPQPTGASITVQSELNKLFVKNTPENLDKTEKVLAELRTPVQVSIEARYVYVRLQEGEDIGIGFTSLTKDWEMGGKHGAEEVKNAGGTVTEAEQYMTGGSHETHAVAGELLSNITDLAKTGAGSIISNLTYTATLNEIQFTSVLRALQSRTDTNTLSAPKLTVLNNKAGIARFVETICYVDTVTSSSTTTGGVTTITYDYTFTDRDIGMILNVTPQVNEATRCVTLFLQPVVSNVERWTTYYPSSSTTISFGRPDFYSKDIETYVTVRDGDTVVLGGFMEDVASKVVFKVPFLSDIPLLGKLFQHKAKSGDKKKLLIFVTVNILDASGNELITPQGTL